MDRKSASAAVEELFAHEAWLRRVAGSLARHDPAAAEDLVQETWIAAMRQPPEKDREPRPWLARVIRNLARMRHRGEVRRAVREREVVAEAAASPDALVEQLEAHQRLGALILALDAEQRKVLLLSFGEGLSSAEIARRLGVPAGTVRWRLKTALDELRSAFGVDVERPRWLLLAPLWKGLAVAKTYKVAVALVVLLVLALVVGKRWVTPSPASSVARPAAAPVVRRVAAEPEKKLPVAPPWMVRADDRPRRIAGKVILAGEKTAVARARVRLVDQRTEAGVAPILERMTGPDGTFDFGLQQAGWYAVHGVAPARQPAVLQVDARGPGRKPAPDALVLELQPCTTSAYGEVTDRDGAPFHGARVALDGDALFVTTGEDGSYEMCIRPETTLTASVDGLAPARTYVAGTGRSRVDFMLEEGVAVTCTVLGLEDGAPVAGVHVRGQAMGDKAMLAGELSGVTDEAGRVQFDPVLPGEKLRFEAMGDGVATSDYHELNVAADRKNEITLLVETMATVRGTIRDERGALVPGVTLHGRQRPKGYDGRGAVSQEDGSFTLPFVSRGEVTLTVDGHLVVTPKSLQVTGDLSGVDVRVESGRLISGRVLGEGGRPVPNARVHALGAGNTNGRMRTDENGEFEIRGLAPIVYRVLAAPEAAGWSYPKFIEVDLRLGDATGLVLELQSGALVAGTVVDEEGTPVAGANVRWITTDHIDQSFTAPDGTFRAAHVTSGHDYAAEVWLDGAKLAAAAPFPRASIATSETQVVGLRLVVKRAASAIAGVVLDDRGEPVAGALVDAPRPGVYTTPAISDATGAFRLDKMPPGAHELLARSADGALRARASAVASGRTDVKIVLSGGAVVGGKVGGFTAVPEIRIQHAMPPYDDVAAAVKSGRFEARGLFPGAYVITAQAPGEQAVARVTLAPGGRVEVDLIARGSATVTGTVVDVTSGALVARAECDATPRSGDTVLIGVPHVTTEFAGDDRGAFTAKVPAGDLWVSCLASGYTSGSVAVSVGENGSATARVLVAPRAKKRSNAGLELDAWSKTARIESVEPGGPAAEAGLRPGDVITAVDGLSVVGTLRNVSLTLIVDHDPGTAVAVTTPRGTFTLTLR